MTFNTFSPQTMLAILPEILLVCLAALVMALDIYLARQPPARHWAHHGRRVWRPHRRGGAAVLAQCRPITR